jgi:hypothetical protein
MRLWYAESSPPDSISKPRWVSSVSTGPASRSVAPSTNWISPSGISGQPYSIATHVLSSHACDAEAQARPPDNLAGLSRRPCGLSGGAVTVDVVHCCHLARRGRGLRARFQPGHRRRAVRAARRRGGSPCGPSTPRGHRVAIFAARSGYLVTWEPGGPISELAGKPMRVGGVRAAFRELLEGCQVPRSLGIPGQP